MSLTSMTGFAEARGAHGTLRWRWEVRSVNGRALDVRLRLPAGFEGLEGGARTLAAERFKRGSLQVVLTGASEEGGRGFRVDAAALADAVRIAKRVAEVTGLAPARVDGILALRGVVVQDEAAALDDEARLKRDAALLESLAHAFDMLVSARRNEGAKLETMLRAQVDEIERDTAEARRLAADQPAALRIRIMTQLADLLGPNSAVPEERLAQEVAMLAGKADVREELDRLSAHVAAVRALLDQGGAIGRKLDFLCQEFNREANTLCSKADDLALTNLGIELKAAIEQLREQAQNIE